VEIDVEPAVLRAAIPILSIQPLVENAVKHGIAPKATGGLVRVEARSAVPGGPVRITVRDTGVGFPPNRVSEPRVGLENVARRLRLCYGPESQLDIQSSAHGSSVSFSIPVPITPAKAEVALETAR
jgi:two-component system LytT family sensor kinase